MSAKRYRLSRDDLESYGDDIASVTAEARSRFEREARAAISSHGDPSAWGDSDRAAIRDAVADLMSGHVDVYGDAVQSIGSRMFEGVIEAQGSFADVPMADAGMERRAVASARQWARCLFGDEPDVDAFIGGCSGFVERHVSHSSDYCILEAANGKRLRKKVRYARVPSGPTCGWCAMLASRGFVYASKETAGEFSRFHSKCDCRVVAGFDGLEVEGYDPDGMYERYRSCRAAIGPPHDVFREFEGLPPEEKARYGREPRANLDGIPDDLLASIGENAGAFSDYYAHRIADEMNARDRQWLYDGTVPKHAKEAGANPLAKELDTADLLGGNGFKVEFRNPARKPGRTSDVYFISGKQDSPVRMEWEFKCPDGDSGKAVKNQLKKAVGIQGKQLQCENIVISNVNSNLTFEQMCMQLEQLDGEFTEISNVIIASTDGRLRRYKRKPIK